MAEHCQGCGTRFGFIDRAHGRVLCAACQSQQDQLQAHARDEYASMLRQAALGLVSASDISADAAKWRATSALAPAELATVNARVWQETVEGHLADDIVSPAEQERLESMNILMGGAMWQALPAALLTRHMVARINGGWLPTVSAPTLLVKKGETAHLEIRVALIEEIIDRVRRGGYAGFSFQVAKGVRFNTGAFQSQSVVVGSHLEAADQGMLSITSSRAVFAGSRKTLELPYSKLLSVNVFSNGIRFQMSNRQSAPLFRVGDGPLVAALVNAAYQRL